MLLPTMNHTRRFIAVKVKEGYNLVTLNEPNLGFRMAIALIRSIKQRVQSTDNQHFGMVTCNLLNLNMKPYSQKVDFNIVPIVKPRSLLSFAALLI